MDELNLKESESLVELGKHLILSYYEVNVQ